LHSKGAYVFVLDRGGGEKIRHYPTTNLPMSKKKVTFISGESSEIGRAIGENLMEGFILLPKQL